MRFESCKYVDSAPHTLSWILGGKEGRKGRSGDGREREEEGRQRRGGEGGSSDPTVKNLVYGPVRSCKYT